MSRADGRRACGRATPARTGAEGRRPRGARRIADGRAGPVGLWQDDAAAGDRRLRARRARQRLARRADARRRAHLRPAGAARHRLRAAGGRAVPASDACEANVGFGLPRRERRGDAVRRAAGDGRARAARASATRTSSPAASSSAWRSPARSRAGREVLLLDEPFSSLDASLRTRVREEVSAAARAGRDDRARHPRPGGGAVAGRHGRGAARGHDRPAGARPRSCTAARRRASSRSSSARST